MRVSTILPYFFVLSLFFFLVASDLRYCLFRLVIAQGKNEDETMSRHVPRKGSPSVASFVSRNSSSARSSVALRPFNRRSPYPVNTIAPVSDTNGATLMTIGCRSVLRNPVPASLLPRNLFRAVWRARREPIYSSLSASSLATSIVRYRRYGA